MHAVDCVYLNKVDCLTHYFQSTYQGVPVRVQRDALSGGGASELKIYTGLTESAIARSRNGTLDTAMRGFIEFVERHIGAPLAGIGLGPERAGLVSLASHPPTPAPVGEAHG